MKAELASQFARDAGKAAALLKVMASNSRLLILCHLSNSGELSVNELVERVGLGRSAMSQHLARLRQEAIGRHAQGSADGILPIVRSEGRAAPRASSQPFCRGPEGRENQSVEGS